MRLKLSGTLRGSNESGRGQPHSRTLRAFREPHSQSGIALVIVMISIFVLAMLAAGFAIAMKVETKLARNANSEAELQWVHALAPASAPA